ncbi:MAG: hypothetical protein H7Y27_03195 [Gemmatimonadaceae bacterium]|nr:hypothetical protein [Chitinophagaceae bacterium]
MQSSWFQNWVADSAAAKLSKELGTRVEIKHVSIGFFNKLLLEGTYIEDQHKDTLLYAGSLKVNITDWFFLREKNTLEYIGLEGATINLHRRDSVWNYQFLIDYFTSPTKGGKKKNIELDLRKIDLDNIHLVRRDEWRGEDLAFFLRSLDLEAKNFDLYNKKVTIQSLDMLEPVFSIYNYPGRRTKRPSFKSRPASDTSLFWNPDGWEIRADDVTIRDGIFKTDKKMERKPHFYFDGQHILFGKINGSFTGLTFIKDTVRAKLVLSTKERSGFEVKSMKADFKMHPRAMEFAKLDIRTGKSRLTDYFSMQYNEFDDLSDFVEKARLVGVFKNSTLHSDDIAFFAPELAAWDKNIRITGTAKGMISDLSAKSVVIHAGNNTVLNGDISMRGLPDINKTYIDFKSNEFRTTYKDAITFLPALKKLNEPRFDKLQFLRFTGNFHGFIQDFVTSGTIETALGTIVTNVNMRFPTVGNSNYSGKIQSNGFALGEFLDREDVGSIAFNGTITGSSFAMKSLQAKLDGEIKSIEFKKYNYQNIKVKGTLSKKLFNGELIADDPNLGINLNGLVDFSQKEPRFDFFATIDRANLKRLKLYDEDIDFNGNFRFDFTGGDIDNFLGSAKIYNASVFKNGSRISFDSLTLESKKIDNSKSIVVVSNEFDAALVGEFSIKELPAAFQTFLNRYYPSYIKPSVRKPTNENFSFVITTKKVDDYLDLLDKNLKGFNYSNISGRINTKESLFDLNAEVPQFSYKNIGFYNVLLQGRGNLDSLGVTTTIADVFVNDSLHFPGTQINVSSANDRSKINVITSANQTLNAANLSGTLQTMQNGFSLVFDPSTFDVNGKRWTIDKDGELTLTRDIVTTEGLKIYSGDQEILISSHPSEIGNSTDLVMELKKINIGDFAPFFVKSNRLEGLLSGRVDIGDPFGKMNVDVSATADQFRLDNDSIGQIQIKSNYSAATGKINFSGLSANENYNFDLEGFVNIADSVDGNTIDIVTHPNKMSIHILEKYLSGIFSRVEGYASGDLRIVGKGGNLNYLGNLTLTDGGLLVDYTKCFYRIPKADIKFSEGLIDFGKFNLTDTFNNTAEMQVGKLYHSNFKDMAFDFRLRTNRLLLLNTSSVDNKQFYGKVIGKANFTFRNPQEDMVMEVVGEPTDSSEIYLPISTGRVSNEADFLSWKVYGREMEVSRFLKPENNLTVKLDLTANSLTRINVILDESGGDQISAIGHGNLKLQAGSREDLSMNGRFDIDRGDYTFSFQSIKRNFILEPDEGNYIQWTGDPYDADLNVTATYRAKMVRFSDLISNSTIGSVLNENVKRGRSDVLVVAKITDKLKAPKIRFDLELPANSQLANDPDANSLLSLIKRDENELNKQVSLLVVFNSFGPSSSSNATMNVGQKALEGIVFNSISGVISNELTKRFSNVLQTVFKDPSIQVNISASVYSGSNLLDVANQAQVLPDRSNVNFSIGKSYFNERLTFIVGSALDFGFNGASNSRNSFQFLPDVTAQYKVTPEGKFLFNLFYRQNTSYLGASIGKQSRSGASISYRKEFERIEDLFRKRKKK